MRRAAEEMLVEQVQRLPGLGSAAKAPRSILVVCCGGVRSAEAAEVLARHGFDVMTLIGGLMGDAMPQDLLMRD